jgi:protoporphyrinogen/coproporphyrinogen III oxidase
MIGRAPGPHVVVVGGGLAGLTAAYRLLRGSERAVRPAVTLLEAGRRLGGKLHTIEVDGLPVEAGADSFVVRKPQAVELCRDLGLEDELVVPGTSGAYVWSRGELVRVIEPSAFGIPARPGRLLRWPGLSVRGRTRALFDLYRRRRVSLDDESLAALLRRRLGSEAAQTLVEPLLGGLHAADPVALSAMATFPELSLWERRHGSLIRGARAAVKAAGGSAGPMFATVWGGLSRMVQALTASIGEDNIRKDAPVKSLTKTGAMFLVEAGPERLETDAVIVATPAFEAARLLAELIPAASNELGAIRYASTAVVILAYPPGSASALPEGTGFVVPSQAQSLVTACTWFSRKWPGPQFEDRAVIRCFVGRDGREDAVGLADEPLIDAVHREATAAVPIGAEPTAARVIRWPRGMPQYDVGHLERLSRIDGALQDLPGVFVTGAAYGGVGIADCIRQANDVAGAVLSFVNEGTPTKEHQIRA